MEEEDSKRRWAGFDKCCVEGGILLCTRKVESGKCSLFISDPLVSFFCKKKSWVGGINQLN